MATKYEAYEDGMEAYSTNINTTRWYAQGFTPSVSHPVTSVKLYLRKIGTPTDGDITVSIRATSSGLPTGSDLASGTINSSTVSAWDWYEITLTTSVTASTTYAIVARFANGDGSNYIDISLNDGGNPYIGGLASYSLNSGSSWTQQGSGGWDVHFSEWGDSIFIPRIFIL